MPTNEQEPREKTVAPELGIQSERQGTIAETAAHWTTSVPDMDAQAAAQFRFRIMVVDGL